MKGESMKKVIKSDLEWREILPPEQYRVCRRKGTEPPFSGRLYEENRPGTYKCVCCGNGLFSSEAKYDSGTGWPSFHTPISEHSLAVKQDDSLGMRRTEVLCARCDAHVGHVFDDGPRPTGLRYCTNSICLDFDASGE